MAPRRDASRHRHALPVLLACLGSSACFPTFQTARIENGIHLDGGFTVLADQRRNDREQAADIVAYVAPRVGFGGAFEIGLPAGVYAEGDDIGSDDETFILWPYLKAGLLGPAGPNHLALILQGAWLAPANVGLRYAREVGQWDLQGGVSVIFSGGPAGDDPLVTRYQEKSQFLTTFSIGAVWRSGAHPSFEVGVLRNRYDEGAVFGDFGQPTVPRTLYDLFVMFRLRML